MDENKIAITIDFNPMDLGCTRLLLSFERFAPRYLQPAFSQLQNALSQRELRATKMSIVLEVEPVFTKEPVNG